MLAFFLFCIYMTTNLGSLLLASAAQKKRTKFLNSSAVTVSEAIKCAMSILMIWASRGGANAQSMGRTILRALFADPLEMLKVCIPAMLYTIQNNVIYTVCAAVPQHAPRVAPLAAWLWSDASLTALDARVR